MSEQRLAVLPLQGKRVLVTRTRDQASALSERLRALGAIPVEFPTIRIVLPLDWQQLDTALARLYTDGLSGQPYYDWLVLTSANGVRICCERLLSLGYDLQAMRSVRIATIGPATAAALARYGITGDLVPDEYIAESVAAALIRDVQQRGLSLKGQHILLARAAEARKILVTELREAGAEVDEVSVYSTLAVAHDDEQGREVGRLLHNHQLDILTFTSSSTVRNFVAWLKSCEQGMVASPLDLVAQLTIACIGPITSQTARELGLHVDIEAKEFTIDGLLEAMIQPEELL
jgi:uroporphyrinogen-III synthase